MVIAGVVIEAVVVVDVGSVTGAGLVMTVVTIVSDGVSQGLNAEEL